MQPPPVPPSLPLDFSTTLDDYEVSEDELQLLKTWGNNHGHKEILTNIHSIGEV